jgi:hypothetical protein
VPLCGPARRGGISGDATLERLSTTSTFVKQLLRRAPLLFAMLAMSMVSGAHINSAPTDDALREHLHGRWGASHDGGRTFWASDEYADDGRIVATGRLDGVDFRVAGDHLVEGHRSCMLVRESTEPQRWPVGQTICADVLHVDDRVMRFRYVGSTQERQLHRILP